MGAPRRVRFGPLALLTVTMLAFAIVGALVMVAIASAGGI